MSLDNLTEEENDQIDRLILDIGGIEIPFENKERDEYLPELMGTIDRNQYSIREVLYGTNNPGFNSYLLNLHER